MKSLFTFPITLYQKTFSSLVSTLFGAGCRYHPTCSDYTKHALKSHGLFFGTLLSFKRILKCSPWGGSGYDPVPPKLS